MAKKVADQLVETLVEVGIKRIYAVTGDRVASLPKIELAQMKGFALTMGKMVLGGRMDEVLGTVKSSYKHLKEVL